MHRFTSEFGMGSGGTNALWPPGKLAEAGVNPDFSGASSRLRPELGNSVKNRAGFYASACVQQSTFLARPKKGFGVI